MPSSKPSPGQRRRSPPGAWRIASSAQLATERKRDVGKEHRELMEAAIARNADALCRLMDGHFRETTNLILDSGFADRGSLSARKPGRMNGPG